MFFGTICHLCTRFEPTIFVDRFWREGRAIGREAGRFGLRSLGFERRTRLVDVDAFEVVRGLESGARGSGERGNSHGNR